MQRGRRIILYSHDTLGQGLRRSRALAAALTREDPAASALILTGSPLAGQFALPERVDHLRLPGVVAHSDGSPEAEAQGLDLDELTALRGSLIRTAVTVFDPDLMIVDTDPAGFRGELLPALELLIARRRARIVLGLGLGLGLRDQTVHAAGASLHYYDEVWVHGPDACRDPAVGTGCVAKGAARANWRVLKTGAPAPAQRDHIQ